LKQPIFPVAAMEKLWKKPGPEFALANRPRGALSAINKVFCTPALFSLVKREERE
jgi:hypothetical protein